MNKKKKILISLLSILILCFYIFPSLIISFLFPLFFLGFNPFEYMPVIRENESHWIGTTSSWFGSPRGTVELGISSVRRAPPETYAKSLDGFYGLRLSDMWTYRGRQLWVQREEKKKGILTKTVVDALIYPRGKYLVKECSKPGNNFNSQTGEGLKIIGLVSEFSAMAQAPIEAWVINTDTGEFVPTSIGDITCINSRPGPGI